ncbi:caspase-14-like [Saccostrea echinata]|uniref:caspase-14-like n=1 Tax=Saccostrea echinata TaxID=191078 RepID=UPI002A82587D|nr:caspase-14-like [Saccostrea echinata]
METSKIKTEYSPISQRKPGRAIQFDWSFTNNMEVCRRIGILQERKRFHDEFLEKLNFKCPFPLKSTRNLTKKDFIAQLHEFEKNCSVEPCGCILVSVSSHGVIRKTEEHADDNDVERYEDFILTYPERNEFSKDFKEEGVSIREIVNIFKNTRKGVPKIFFIQACRGKHEDNKIDLGIETKGDVPVPYTFPAMHVPSEDKMVFSPPCIEDSVIVFSTPIGYVSGFNSKQGSHVWTILLDKFTTLCKNAKPINLLDLLRETNNELAKDNTQFIGNVVYKPLLSVCHCLTKHIIFE